MSELPQMFQRDGLCVWAYDDATPQSLAESSVAGDVAFYTELARECGGPVLEVACGTGRVAWEIARSGVDVVGFDLSEAMLAYAEAKRRAHTPEVAARATFFRADMTAFDAGLRFPLIIVPFRAFQVLLDVEDQRRALTCMREHLTEDGRLVIDLFDARLEYLMGGVTPTEHRVVDCPQRGTTIEITIRNRTFDVVRQRLHEEWYSVERDASGMVVAEETDALDLRWFFRYEMRHLFELCGLSVEAEYSDFRRSPPDYAKEQVWVARRA